MKHIIKQSEPIELEEFKVASNPPNWIPSYDNLTTIAKNATKKALMEEQGCICCYCERGLVENDSHIEHFQPQSYPNVDDSLSDNELKTFINSHLQRDSSGKFGEFHTTIKYIFSTLAA